MYILLAFIAACSIGIALHYSLPKRELRGVAVTPAIATVAAGVIYTALQWAGLPATSVWLWLASIGGGVAIAAISTTVLVRTREARDAAQAAKLGLVIGEGR
jgi:predicted Kef-type K+ transport protein